MARERIEVAIDERWSPLARETSEITSRMVSRGVLRSSMTANQLLELYRNELDIQACIAWGHLNDDTTSRTEACWADSRGRNRATSAPPPAVHGRLPTAPSKLGSLPAAVTDQRIETKSEDMGHERH
jgi:hypothetical protein